MSTAFAQIAIKGTVLDETGEPIPFASVVIKGTSVGTNTDIDGRFHLSAPTKKSILTVSYLGYMPFETSIDNKTTFEIKLKSDNQLLDEVVIVGYGTQKKVNATGAVKTIDNAVLESRPISNAVQGLQGAIAGLNISNDNGGGLGESMQINIRGVGSIGEGSDSSPLILIDGMEGDLSTINPNDIENISVLKDAAAASIYGSRAPFGVVLVTTKSGDKETRVNYSGNVRFQQPIKVPQMADSYTFALIVNDAYLNSGGNKPFGTTQLNRILAYKRGEITYGTMPYENQNTWMRNQACFADTNWYDVFLKKVTTSQEHNFSVSGGGDKVTYYFSGNYMGQTGLFNYADEKYSRLSLNGKVGVKFNNYVRMTWNTRIINTDNEKPSAMNALFYHNLGRRAATVPVFMPNGEYNTESLIPAMKDGGKQVQKIQQFYNQATFTVEPIKGWRINADISSRIENNPYTRQFNPIYFTQPDGTLEGALVLEGIAEKHVINEKGEFVVQPGAGEKYYEKASTNINYFSTNVYSDYEWKFKENNFKFLIGGQSEYFSNNISRAASRNILLPDVPFLPSETGGKTTMISDKRGEWASMGFFGRINYVFADKYMAEINLRADGASRFPTDKRWAMFPSFSAGWNIAQENFWKRLYDIGFEYLKIRGSYGTLGNQNTTSFYPYYQQMSSTSGNLVLGGEQATVLPMYKPYSTSLTWEKIENVGAGVDWGFLRNRLTGSFDWYQRTTKDMVGPAKALSAIYGDKAPKTNNAELRTRGWELEVGWRDRIGKDFTYSVSATLSDYKTIITKYDSPDGAISGWYQGKVFGDIWGYQVLGIAKSDEEMSNYLQKHSQSSIGSKWGGGDLMYADLDDNGSVDQGSGTLDNHGDMRVIGNSTPRYSYSITLNAKWKWIDFRAFFQGVGSRDVFFKNSATFFGMAGEWQRTILNNHLDYFRYAGSELGANLDPYYGRIRIDENNIQVSDRFLQNAGYLRLKNLQIGFSLPENTKLSKYVRNARLYISGENLFTFTKLRIYDPEAVGSSDSEYGPGKTYPQYRTYSIGLELTF